MKKNTLFSLGIACVTLACVVGGTTGCNANNNKVQETVSPVEENETEVTDDTAEVEDTEDSDAVEEDNSSSNVNIGGENPLFADFDSFGEKYMQFEEIEPTTMYVKDVATRFANPSQFEGKLVVRGNIFAEDDEEITVVAKGTYKDVEYYVEAIDGKRQYIIKADDLTATKPTGDSSTPSTDPNTGNAGNTKSDAEIAEENKRYEDILREAGIDPGETSSGLTLREKGDLSQADPEVIAKAAGRPGF